MNRTPVASAWASKAGARTGEANNAPLSPITPANNPLASGEAISALAANDPADSPVIRDLGRVAAERRDVALHPSKRRNKVEKPIVA